MAGHHTLTSSDVIGDFLSTLNDLTIQPSCGHPFVRISELARWLRSPTPWNQSITRLKRLLDVAYYEYNRETPGCPLLESDFDPGQDCCLRVFCILVRLDAGHLAHIFKERGILDRRLPITLLELQEKFPDSTLPHGRPLAEGFDEMQWRFCPVKLEFNMLGEYDRKYIFPISRKEEIKQGGTACVWQIEVLQEFVGEKLQAAVPNSLYDPNDGYGPRYQFALKSFKDGNIATFRNEKKAFLALRNNCNMVKYLGGFSHWQNRFIPPSSGTAGSDETLPTWEATHNILLEFGENDLDGVFADETPPETQYEITMFWKELFKVANAISFIHNIKNDDTNGATEFSGWHADIKPDNILYVDGAFKLADPGFALFRRKGTGGDCPKESMHGGTESYGAPECLRSSSRTSPGVTQSIDIWAFGCVLSVTATWVVLSAQGILVYDKLRKNAIKKSLQEQTTQNPNHVARSLNNGDYFHNGQKVLDVVTEWHEHLRQHVRISDTITSSLLDLVDERMLVADPTKRISASELCEELKHIIQKGKRAQTTISESIREVLYAVDQNADAAKRTKSKESQLGQNRAQTLDVRHTYRQGKSKVYDRRLMKTPYRSKYLESGLPPIAKPEEPLTATSPDLPRKDIPLTPDQSPYRWSNLPPQTSRDNSSHKRNWSAHRLSSLQMSPPPLPRSATSRNEPPKPQNVFQAREEMETWRSKKKNIIWKKQWRDQELSRYFKDRDIEFLVDNGATMKPHWYEAGYVLETLVMKAAGVDTDGMDLYFTFGTVNVKNKSNPKDFMEAMRNKDALPNLKCRTDIRKALSQQFSEYIQKLDKSKSENKYLTLLVLTDGIWGGVQNYNEVSQVIEGFVNDLRKRLGQNLYHRPVSIEFIQFGNDEDATFRLRQLDEGQEWRGIPDLIDTEPSNGDVYNMLLGSFVPEYDERNDKEIATPSSPSPADSSAPSQRTILATGPAHQSIPPKTPVSLAQYSSHPPTTPSRRGGLGTRTYSTMSLPAPLQPAQPSRYSQYSQNSPLNQTTQSTQRHEQFHPSSQYSSQNRASPPQNPPDRGSTTRRLRGPW